jgi:replication factor A1
MSAPNVRHPMADAGSDGAPVETRLRDLRATERPIAITARVLTVERREVRRKSDGGVRPVLSGLLSDGTGTARFTWWDPPKDEVDRGTVLRAAPVSVREFRGKPELSFGWKTRVAPASESELPTLDPAELEHRKVATLAAGEEGFLLEARVAEVERKTVAVGTDRREIHQGLLEDGTGLVAFTAWNDFRLVVGEALRIHGAYVRVFRSRPQLVLDERAHVERFDGKGLPAPGTAARAAAVALGILADGRGAERATVEGLAVALQPPSGIVLRCPTCPRVTNDGVCRVHGAVTPHPDLRVRLVLDDGTGNVTVNLDREDAERVTGRTLDECRKILSDRVDPTAVEDALLASVFGRTFRARGPLTRDDFGLSMYPTDVALVLREPEDGRAVIERALAEARR